MNILYIAFKDFSVLHYGASKKVISGCRALRQLGHDVTLIGRKGLSTIEMKDEVNSTCISEHKPFLIAKLQPLSDKKNQIIDIIRYIKDKEYDLCYIRFDLNDRDFIVLLKNLKKHCKKIVIEIPTYPYTQEYTGILNKVRLDIDDFFARKIHSYVDAVITFYNVPDGNYYNVPVIQVPNGFDYEGIDLASDINGHEGEVITQELLESIPLNIAAVSSMRHWHGYERFIEGMKNYYCNGGFRQIVLHLIGDGRERTKYEQLIEKYGLQDKVIVHGAMFGEELDHLLNGCMLGIDSLARHRTGISVLSSLKSREYGAKGIPFINSCKIDIIGDEFKYMLEVPADESPISIDDIISFNDRIYVGNTRRCVAMNIREYVMNKSDMKAVMSLVLKFLKYA